ncbi:MAG TPA: LptF/LptG family permease [Gemmatimonadaceae bacterium]|nr:LptF/LptG family permease [Gemmatimonadaceae bacterium]
MKILQRYILREHIGPLIFSLAALTSLLLLNQVAKQFGNLVGKGLSWGVIGEFFMLSVPFIIAMTLPMAVLVATLYAFSRLAAENEITALKASGVGIWRIIRPVLWGAAGISLIMLGFNDQVLPRSNHRLRTLQSDIARTKPTFALKEQVINEVSPGKLYLRAGHVDERSNGMREITIYDLSNPARRRTIHADSGRMVLAANRQDLELTLYNGFSQEVPRENPSELQRLYYVTDLVKVRGVANSFDRTTEDTYKSDREMSICEMQNVVARQSRQIAAARRELESTLGNAAWFAATGERRPATTPDSSTMVRSLGEAYCRWVVPLFGVRSAEAAEPEARQAAVRQPGVQQQGARQQPAVQQPAARQQGAPRQQPAARRDTAWSRRAQGAPAALPRRATGDSVRIQVPPGGRAVAVPVRAGARDSSARAAAGAAPDTQPAAARPPSAGAAAAGPRAGIAMQSPPLTPASVRVQAEMLATRLEQAREGRNQYEVEIQKKFALSVACVVFVLLGAPIALRFPRGGVGLVIGVSLVVFALYYIGLIGGETLADKVILSPFWAMWLPNITFTIVGIFFLHRVRRSGATSRGGDAAEVLDAVRASLARVLRRVGIPADRRRAVTS